MMKKSMIYIVLGLVIFSSCSDWLDVSPVTEVREDELFSDEEGYKNALTGVYIQLGKIEMYGKTVSMYIPEMMAYTWTIPTESTDPTAYHLAKFDYANSDVETAMDDMWSNFYTSIAQLNNILENIESSKVNFTNGNRDLIAGEAYGLRAFLHLDLLRLFGPLPGNAVNADISIPYSKEFTTDVAKLKSISYEEVVADIKIDLDKAEERLKNDPAIKTIYSLDASSSSDPIVLDDSWQYYRQLRFNYYAVLGSKARFYYWIGEKEKAAEFALKVINAADENGNKIFTLVDEAYYASHGNANLNMKSEHLFGVYNSNFATEVYSAYYGKANSLFTQKKDYVSTAYESSLCPDDIRNKGTRYWTETDDEESASRSFHYYKYAMRGASYGAYTVPLMRLSEMYFILFEDESIDTMLPYFKKWRLSRGLDSSLDNSMTTSSSVIARMEKEWRKEFFGEGQMFYFYKRHAYAAYTWPITVAISLDNYVIPKPKSQTQYE